MDLYGTIVGTIVYSMAFLWVVCLLFGAPSVFLIIGLPFFIFALITLIVFFICVRVFRNMLCLNGIFGLSFRFG